MTGKIESLAAGLREIAAGDDSYEAFLHVEASALDRIVAAADLQGDSDANRLAEVRDVVAALRLVKAERAERRRALRERPS